MWSTEKLPHCCPKLPAKNASKLLSKFVCGKILFNDVKSILVLGETLKFEIFILVDRN